jgi:hypothetical protein
LQLRLKLAWSSPDQRRTRQKQRQEQLFRVERRKLVKGQAPNELAPSGL